MHTLLGILIVAAAATLGDFLWYSLGVRNSVVTGVVHGALLLTTVGGVLGARSGRVLRGLPMGTLAGVGGALAYYAIVAVFGRRAYGVAIPAAWVILWVLLAVIDGRWLRAPATRSWGNVMTRGAIAAVAGGVAFSLVMQTLWGPAPASGRNYLVQFAAWAVAWAPGIVALVAERPGARRT